MCIRAYVHEQLAYGACQLCSALQGVPSIASEAQLVRVTDVTALTVQLVTPCLTEDSSTG